MEKIAPHHHSEHPSHDEHDHAESEHLGDFAAWHFLDIISDTTRVIVDWAKNRLSDVGDTASKTMQKLKGALPSLRTASRVLPVVGLAGETAHVFTPFNNMREDYKEGKISFKKAAGLTLTYAAYAISGLGGFLTIGIKESLTQAVRHSGAVEERYIPHTLTQEFKHAFGENDEHGHDEDNHDNKSDHHQHEHNDHVAGPSHFHNSGNVENCQLCAKAFAQVRAEDTNFVAPPINLPKVSAKLLTDNAELL